MRRYTIGVDYGSLSARGVLADIENGEITAQAEYVYPHATMDTCLPDGTPLGEDWALQHPVDYEQALEVIIPALMRGVSPQQVVGLGIDFTASTVVPLDADFRPLCKDPEFAGEPHAWPKQWKHHAAQEEAKILHRILLEVCPEILDHFGGTVSMECLLAKAAETCRKAPRAYAKTAWFAEAGDYITSLLAGHPVCSLSAASAKAKWLQGKGYPDTEIFRRLHPDLENLTDKLLLNHKECVSGYPGQRVGVLCPAMAEKRGLQPGTPLSAFQMEAYSGMPGVGLCQPGSAILCMGTANSIMVLGQEPRPVFGATASLPDCYFPGIHGYAAGQASVGDGFAWFVRTCVPEQVREAAAREGLDIHRYLTRKAEKLSTGESGLLSPEWFNGDKSHPSMKLTGVMTGLTMQTRPEELYRMLLEATAYGARRILEHHENAGVKIHRLVACGGIAGKNKLMMQIYADVLGREIQVSTCTQAPALGAAIYAASAASDKPYQQVLFRAVEAMSWKETVLYRPRPEAQAVYEKLYQRYCALADFFTGPGGDIMAQLAQLKSQ